MMKGTVLSAIVLVSVVVLGILQIGPGKPVAARAQNQDTRVPVLQFDPSWPKLEGHFGDHGNWIFGATGGIAVDPANDHVWVITRPHTLLKDEAMATQQPPLESCCVPSPTVLEFDADGNFLRGWGGPGPGYDWPNTEHAIRIDYRGNVWITGSGKGDDQVLKFTEDGKFLLQIGHPGKSSGEEDTENLNEPTNTWVYPKTNEAFVTDGYMNRRVIVFDADTGAYKRMWGAYGHKPDDAVARINRFPFVGPQYLPAKTLLDRPAPQQFNLPHDVMVSNDGLVYIADRTNNRIQVFKPDGAFVKEAFVAKDMLGPVGTVIGVAVSADKEQRYIFVLSGDERLRILDRQTLAVIGQFGRLGHFPGQFYHTHGIAADSKGNIYTAEAAEVGRRVQKFLFKGFTSAPNQ